MAEGLRYADRITGESFEIGASGRAYFVSFLVRGAAVARSLFVFFVCKTSNILCFKPVRNLLLKKLLPKNSATA